VLVIQTAAVAGRRGGLLAAFAMMVGALAWAAAALYGLQALFARFEWLHVAFRIGGAAYLLYLAVMLWRHAGAPLPEMASRPEQASGRQVLLRAFLLQMSNPKIMVFFGSIFLSLLPAHAPDWLDGAALAIVAFNEFTWFVLLALLFSGDRARAFYLSAKLWLDRVMGGVLGPARPAARLRQLADARLHLGQAGRSLVEHDLGLAATGEAQRIAALALGHVVELPARRSAAPAFAQACHSGAGMAQADLDDGSAARVGIRRDPPFAGEDPPLADQPDEIPSVGRRVMDLCGPAAQGPQPGLVAHAPACGLGRGVGNCGLELRHRHGGRGRRRGVRRLAAAEQGDQEDERET
jgi:threonine/homoserine/homoserine lactone efflux protein